MFELFYIPGNAGTFSEEIENLQQFIDFNVYSWFLKISNPHKSLLPE